MCGYRAPSYVRTVMGVILIVRQAASQGLCQLSARPSRCALERNAATAICISFYNKITRVSVSFSI